MTTIARLAAAVGAVAVLVACSAPAPPPPDPGLPQRLVESVTGDGAYRHLDELQRIADANGGNRALGTPGYDASVEYVADVLRDAGYQVDIPSFTASRFELREVRLTVDGAPVSVTALEFSPSTPEGGLTAPLAVIAQDDTSGCEAADFAGVPAGAIVLVRRGTCTFDQKATTAAAAGAGAVLMVNNVDGPLAAATLGNDVAGTVPVAGLSQADGAALVGRAGTPTTLVLMATVEEADSRNVIAQTRTGNPDEVVMAGAHLDSVPDGPGINDNGSGTAALLETAVRLGDSPPVANTVRFAFWGAEEVGLVGSTSYVGGLAEADRKRIALYLNLDMVASPNAGYLIYDGDDSDAEGAGPGPAGSAVIERVLAEGLAAAGVTATEGTDFDGRSDYSPFIDAAIPSGGLFTGGEDTKTAEQAQRWGGTADAPFDPCYHQICDRIDAVDRTALDRNVDAVAAALAQFALSTGELTG
ncbi:MAG: M20/M25/M40 family metallo-hydrolase [Pseudonocardia sp.]